eukprot:50995_1
MTQLYLLALTLITLICTNQSHNENHHNTEDCNSAEIKKELKAEGHSHVDYSHGGDNWQGHGAICEKHGLEAPDQSPIDITDDNIKKVDDDFCDSDLEWDVEWDHKRFLVKNDCHSVTVFPMDSHNNELGSSRDTIAKLKLDDTPFEEDAKYDEYCLLQFHFHWGEDSSVGSEHLIKSKRFPLELHFVHYACHFGNFSEAQKMGQETSLKHLGDAEHT